VNRIRLYMDEDALQVTLVKALRESDIDVITVADAGRLGCSDEEQLIWAAKQGRVIYSFNMGDFYQLHSVFLTEGKSHAGIVLVQQQRYSIREQLRGLLKLVTERSATEMIDQLIFLSAYIRSG
jgi:hypothetical protein